MTIHRIIFLGFLAATCLTAPAFAQTPYDGLWNVTILTKAGSCEPSARYPLTVADGRVSGTADVSGSIGPAGNRQGFHSWRLRQRSNERQFRLRQMERGVRWNSLQRPLGSIATVTTRLEAREPRPGTKPE